MNTPPPLIAFVGWSGAGKDTAAQPLLDAGYARHNFGDIVKRQIDPLIRKELGFSAFTEDRAEKNRVRRTLEMWGEDNYENILAEFLATLPPKAVNTKLMRRKEALAWKERGGQIWHISNPRVQAFSQFEAQCFLELGDLVDGAIFNDADPATLALRVRSRFGLPMRPAAASKPAPKAARKLEVAR